MIRNIHPIYSKIVDEILDLDTRDFQVPRPQRLVVAMNYLHRGDKPMETENTFNI